MTGAGPTTDPFDAPIELDRVQRIEGPLLFVTGASEAGWDEYVEIHADGQPVRRGVVIDVSEEIAVVEVFEGTSGLGTDGTVVSLTGRPLHVPVTERWLGRVLDGRGTPIDGGPPIVGSIHRAVAGRPINPARRDVPRNPVITGVRALDVLTTLVRGQKLPIFSIGGLPHLELAIQIASQAHASGAPFRVVFAGMGLTNADANLIRGGLDPRLHRGEAVLFINGADDSPMERLLTPRIALTVAEHLAFELGHHVLVILTDMTSYCDALRQLSAARGEIPSRRSYPAYLFSDLASIYERCGRLRDRPGSITELPVLTMPAGDITHPVPDLTGYITEGQVVLSRELHQAGVYPPIDALSSLSRLMRRGAGADRTRADHLAVAAQLLGLLADARRAGELAELIGADALSVSEQRAVDYAQRFEHEFLSQEPLVAIELDDALDAAWATMSEIPTRELTVVTPEQIDAHLHRPTIRPPRTENTS